MAAILLVMALDAMFDIESTAVRCLLSAGALVATLWVAWRFLARPLGRAIRIDRRNSHESTNARKHEKTHGLRSRFRVVVFSWPIDVRGRLRGCA